MDNYVEDNFWTGELGRNYAKGRNYVHIHTTVMGFCVTMKARNLAEFQENIELSCK